MGKKRLGIFLFILVASLTFFASIQIAAAGCCVGLTGCDRAFSTGECAPLQSYVDIDCADETNCDIGVCCHSLPGVGKAMWRTQCIDILGPTDAATKFTRFGAYDPNPQALEGNAESICGSGLSTCQFASCEEPNVGDCLCGLTQLNAESNPYCCSTDNSAYDNQQLCQRSTSCVIRDLAQIHGMVTRPDGSASSAIANAKVRAGGKEVFTQANGSFVITGLLAPSTGAVLVSKNQSINSTTFTIGPGEEDVDVGTISLAIVVTAISAEDCNDKFDGDDDQFGFQVPPESVSVVVPAGSGYNPDFCDPDCNTIFSHTVIKSVVQSDFDGHNELRCDDLIDNDCDGFIDAQDDDCGIEDSYCGDGVIQFPNKALIFEQCDAIYDDFGNILQQILAPDGSGIIAYTGGDTIGDDSRCPGRCLAPGDPNACRCEAYVGVCGDDHVDQPEEDCDALFDDTQGVWTSVAAEGSRCDVNTCGRPTPYSATPCVCDQGGSCGDGKVDLPYENCDAGPGTNSVPLCPNGDPCPGDCRCPPTPVCGNNIIEPGEDCDGIPDPQDTTNNPWTEFKQKKLGCNPSRCGRKARDDPGEPWPGSVENPNPLASGQAGERPCSCPDDCRLSPPGPNVTSVEATYLAREVKIEWGDICQSNNEFYNMLRCECDETSPGEYDCANCANFGSNPDVRIVNAEVLHSLEYSDTTIEANKKYCYAAKGVYDVTTTSGRPIPVLESEEVQCIITGSDRCFDLVGIYADIGNVDEFCLDGTRTRCASEKQEDQWVNQELPVDGEANQVFCKDNNKICVGPHSSGTKEGTTECIDKSLCDACSDALGLFSVSFFSLPPEYGRSLIGGTPLSCDILPSCYLDQTLTSINKFHILEDVPSCYDFKSKDACLEKNASAGSQCEWIWSKKYKEIGIGVCRSTIVENQNCSLCHDPMNKVFGTCDREMCGLYGRCYYDKLNQTESFDPGYPTDGLFDVDNTLIGREVYYRCTNEKYITCKSYDSEEDCAGSRSPYSIAGSELTNVRINVSGFAIDRDGGEVFVKQSGSNVVDDPSDDFFGFGKCEWSRFEERLHVYPDRVEDHSNNPSELCYKNSDSSPGRPLSETDAGDYTSVVILHSDDCGLVSTFEDDDLGCRKDVSPPVTILPDISDGSEISGVFKIVAKADDVSFYGNDTTLLYTNEYPVTYACITDRAYCYPNGTADKVVDTTSSNFFNNISYENIFPAITGFTEFETGDYTIYYFSEDISHNLEVVKSVNIHVDADAPDVRLTFSNTSFEIYTDIWRTNLTISLETLDEPATCKAELRMESNGRYSNIQSAQNISWEYNDTWTKQYAFLPDGPYIYYYYCEDNVGNFKTEERQFIIDGDRSLTNPRPKGTMNASALPVQLRITTGTKSSCKYQESYDDIQSFEDELTDPGDVILRQNALYGNSITGATMVAFENQGGVLGVDHASTGNDAQGYHRYYVRCVMDRDGVVRGNAADEIKYAIDLEPPTTIFKSDVPRYNNWYNGYDNNGVRVTLECEDPAIFGEGREWQFGDCAEKMFYCLSENCKDFGQDEFRIYTPGDEIPLTETEYITFYSVDEGG